MDNRGYIRLSRKFFKNKYWLKERTHSQAEAWLDLIQMARFEAEPLSKVLASGRQIVIERGEIHASLRFLSARWKWGIMQVRTFLKECVISQRITQRITQGENIITLCKYENYNPLFYGNITPDNTPDNTPVTHRYHTDNTNIKKENKVKKVKEEKKVKKENFDAAKAATLARRDKFYQSLVPCVEKYGKDMIRDFYDYWIETNKSGVKMRFELQATWELPLRLATWAKRDKTFTNSSKQKNHETTETEIVG